MKAVFVAGFFLLAPVCLIAQAPDSIPSTSLNEWKLSCYPNPTSDLLIVSSSEAIKSITLLDLNGQVIKAPAMPNWCFSLHDLPTGWLFVYVESVDGRIEKKNVYKY